MSLAMSPGVGTRRALGALLQRARDQRGRSIEEIAERAGVGTAWYAWLEAGRNLALSYAVLDWVAAALELSPALRKRALALAGLESPSGLTRVRAETVPAGARAMLDGLPRFPAYITGRRGDVLAWNEASEALYRCSSIPVSRRNTILFLFTQPDVRRLVVNWEAQARRAVHSHRAVALAHPDDEWIGEVQAVAARASAEFRMFWREAATSVETGPFAKVFQKRTIGRLTFHVEELVPSEARDRVVTVYVPDAHDGTQRRLESMLAIRRRGGDARARREHRHRLVRRVKEHLDETYMRDLPAEELAGLSGVDRFQLTRIFAEDVGFPPHAYRILVRLERAKRLLARGDAAVDVAAAVGFVDQSHLSRHFRRVEGMTPGQFARRAREEL